ncbi:MAG: sensor histidine kinase [Gemmatimonadetes bacterium]|nr:sensor histidine kinase [Gemmatimonadota bacterium]
MLLRFWQIDGPIEDRALQMTRPFPGRLEARWFSDLTGMTLDITFGSPERVLRATLRRLEGDGWLLVGTPLVRTLNDLHAKGLSLADLSHLGIGDLLVANEAATLAQASSERSLRELGQRRVELEVALRERSAYLQEIHHRVKNNLQIISSMLALQVERLDPAVPREPFFESIRRVRAIALTHEMLYQMESVAEIDLGAYARALCETLRTSIAGDSIVEVISAPVLVAAGEALPIGLVLNELVTNALKYGRSADGSAPNVQITICAVEEGFSLSVRDHGPGLPLDFNLAKSDRLGLTLVRALSKQLCGQLEISALRPGVCFTLVTRQPVSEPARAERGA